MDSQKEEVTEGLLTPMAVDKEAAKETRLAGFRTTLSVIPREEEEEGNLHSEAEEESRRMDITSSLIKVEVTEGEAAEEATTDITSNCKVLTTFKKD